MNDLCHCGHAKRYHILTSEWCTKCQTDAHHAYEPMSEINISINLQPFRVPNYVLVEGKTLPRQQGFTELPKYALSELDESVLSRLCDQFRAEVFEKAAKEDPRALRNRSEKE